MIVKGVARVIHQLFSLPEAHFPIYFLFSGILPEESGRRQVLSVSVHREDGSSSKVVSRFPDYLVGKILDEGELLTLKTGTRSTVVAL